MKNTNTVKIGLMYILLIALMSTSIQGLYAQSFFFEDFQNGMPDDFLIVDQDGLTPITSSFTDAWVALNDDQDTSNVAAASTSWYDPIGRADDWLITPMIAVPDTSSSLVLKWQGRAFQPEFPDGYEVRLSTDTARTVDSYNTLLFTTSGENPNWTTRMVNLDDYKGQSVSIAFRNNSLDQNILYIDNIEVAIQAAFDVELSSLTDLAPGYTLVPISQVAPLELEVEVTNQGANDVDSVRVDAFIVDRSGVTVFFTDDMGGPLASLASGESHTFNGTGSFVPPDTGLYFAAYFVSILQEDVDTTNNFNFIGIDIADSTYARDLPPVTNIFGIGDQADGLIGQTFEINNIDTLTSIFAVFVDPPVGQDIKAVVYLMGTNAPTQLLYESTPYTFTTDDNPTPDGEGEDPDIALISFGFASSSLLVPGNYFFGVEETGDNIRLGATQEIYTEGTTFLFIAQQDIWLTGEQGYSPGFSNAFIIRPNFGVVNNCNIEASIVTTQDDGAGTGTAVITPTGGTLPYTYLWSSGQSTDVAVNLAGGAYTVTVTDAIGCENTFEVFIGTVSIADDLAAGLNKFDVYPNPNSGNFTINIELSQRDDLEMAIYDMQGKIVYTKVQPASLGVRTVVELSGQTAGIYMLRITTTKGSTFRRILLE